MNLSIHINLENRFLSDEVKIVQNKTVQKQTCKYSNGQPQKACIHPIFRNGFLFVQPASTPHVTLYDHLVSPFIRVDMVVPHGGSSFPLDTARTHFHNCLFCLIYRQKVIKTSTGGYRHLFNQCLFYHALTEEYVGMIEIKINVTSCQRLREQ